MSYTKRELMKEQGIPNVEEASFWYDFGIMNESDL
jgi:hypothetical protein